MNLEVKVTDQRDRRNMQFIQHRETEDYIRSEVTASGNAVLIAETLRAIADEIDPRTAPNPSDPTDMRVPSFERVSHIDFGGDVR